MSNDHHLNGEDEALQQPNEDCQNGGAVMEEENEEEDERNLEEIADQMMKNEKILKKTTRQTSADFTSLVEEVKESFEATTWRGTVRLEKETAKHNFKPETGVFITLFWLHHYPTLDLMSCIFNAHPHTITHIL